MLTCTRTNAENKDFQKLVEQLDDDLRIRDGEDHVFYAQLNKTGKIKYVIVAYDNKTPIGCGAIRVYSPTALEIKRMFVLPGKRRQGIASMILEELEHWAAELKYGKCLLETGKNQPEAIEFYSQKGYEVIPNFGKYKNVNNSICFKKLVPTKFQ